MALEKTYRRLPLRDLLTDAQKRSRDVADNVQSTLLVKVSDLRELREAFCFARSLLSASQEIVATTFASPHAAPGL